MCLHATTEPKGRTLTPIHIERRSCLTFFQAHLPIEYWGECVKAAVYLMNGTPSQILNGKTPYEKFYNRVPAYTHLRVFGCLAYAHNVNHRGDKFAARNRRCMFLGYPPGKKGWNLYDLEREVIFTSRDVVFCEDQFPFASSPAVDVVDVSVPTPSPAIDIFQEEDSLTNPVFPVPTDNVLSNPPADTNTPIYLVNEDSLDIDHDDSDSVSSQEEASALPPSPAPEDALGRGHRQKSTSSRLRDYVVNTVAVASPLSRLKLTSSTAVFRFGLSSFWFSLM